MDHRARHPSQRVVEPPWRPCALPGLAHLLVRRAVRVAGLRVPPGALWLRRLPVARAGPVFVVHVVTVIPPCSTNRGGYGYRLSPAVSSGCTTPVRLPPTLHVG